MYSYYTKYEKLPVLCLLVYNSYKNTRILTATTYLWFHCKLLNSIGHTLCFRLNYFDYNTIYYRQNRKSYIFFIIRFCRLFHRYNTNQALSKRNTTFTCECIGIVSIKVQVVIVLWGIIIMVMHNIHKIIF